MVAGQGEVDEPMRTLQVQSVAADGTHAVLSDESGQHYRLPVDERLRAALRGEALADTQLSIGVSADLGPRVQVEEESYQELRLEAQGQDFAANGYRAEIVQDCFVHHFGSRSFAAAGVDYQKQIQRQWDIFKAKWGIPAGTAFNSPVDLGEILARGFDPGCHFHPRCPYATDRCKTELPELRPVDGRLVACHHAEELPEEATGSTPALMMSASSKPSPMSSWQRT